ncbi:pilus assembly PilX N-terminal domain-containing protein [Rheinheimera sp. 1928-s]|uniref:pilus assembly PilX N-terminal domain-containing protein n=1 Tax=Rheinheimera sp. 1928-s TaxID=3033803 RepID=UPI00260425AA|nr:pilus assembly PilX N-terminal domain-containing protein [Rheinheimera sp. 1928-s]MDF3124917.1 pilus assembly PilX N-terminal domain-containing protein [Rheinheimera sp. 1928-s]
MYPDFSTFHPKKQQGSALIVAVFIIVVMTLLVAALSKLLTSSSESISYEVLGTRAFFAAQSGMEQGLAQLFPLTTPSTYCAIPPAADRISATDVVVSLSGNGLQGCSFTLSCDAGRASPDAAETIYYQLTSTGTCGDPASVQTSRTIEMEVWQ